MDETKIKYYICDEVGHSGKIKNDKGKSKTLITSSKDWMDSSDSDKEEVNYGLIASFEESAAPDVKVSTTIFNSYADNMSEF